MKWKFFPRKNTHLLNGKMIDDATEIIFGIINDHQNNGSVSVKLE